MEFDNLYNVFIATYKDYLSVKQFEEIKLCTREIIEADAEARRAKKSELILSIAKLRQKLEVFECTYSLIKEKCGSSDEVDQYINSIKREIDDLLRKKTSHHF